MKNYADWLNRFLFIHARQTAPDGRPLYAYKCTDNQYAALRELTKELALFDCRGRMAPRTASIFKSMFCLYAAETFCREHSEGVWTWETVFAPLEIPSPSFSKIADWVEQGLNWWQRPLIHGKLGDRRFLVTIACEGGLPLRLLQKENTKLTQYFRTILENYHLQGCDGPDAAEAIARAHADGLPLTLRQDVVFHLGGELVAQVVELQRGIGDAPNPIAALDERIEGWRRKLPLRMVDQTAEALFKGLVQKSRELTLAKAARLRWRGRLRETANGFHVEKSLELPERLSSRQIAAWLGQNLMTKPRLRLMLHTPSGSEAVAWLTLIQGTGDSAIYRREWLRRGGLVLFGASVSQLHLLTLHDGQNEHSLAVHEGEPWDDLPWVFVERGTSSELEWLTQGSAQTRAEQAWILADESLTPYSADADAYRAMGKIAELGRTVYQVSGQVDFLTPEQDRYRIICRAENESDVTFALLGETLFEALGQRPLYKGLPRIQATDAEGQRLFPTALIQWRPLHARGHWREGDAKALGRIWLRLTDRQSGIEQFRRQIDVLPQSFRLERRIGSGQTPGHYRLFSLEKAQLELPAENPLRITVGENDALIECPALAGASLPVLSIGLRWPGADLIHLILPYPQRGAVFQLAGFLLQRDDLVPLDRLGGLRLMLQDPAGGNRFWLDGDFIANVESAEGTRPRLSFRDRLPPLVGV